MSEDNWKEELRSAYLYRILSNKEKNTPQEKLFRQLANEAEEQAKIWQKELPPFHPDTRTKIVSFLIKNLGPRAILPILAAHKVRGLSIYRNPLAIHPTPTSTEEIGGRHRLHQNSGNLRASIFGINDGIVSNTLLILGFAGASSSSESLVLAGTAGLLAGAFSMAAGEFVSVRSQKEMVEYQIDLERQELETYPEEEAAELAMIYEAKGMEPSHAKALSLKMIQDPEVALDTLIREEIGVDPKNLGSPIQASIYSFISFSVGAFVPLIPFCFSHSMSSLYIGVALSGLALFLTGSFTSLLTGKSFLYGGLRMLSIGTLAGTVIYLIGELFGQSLG